jgi:hypothetical protein
MRPSTTSPVRTLASVLIAAAAAWYGSTSTTRPWKVSHPRPPRPEMGSAQGRRAGRGDALSFLAFVVATVVAGTMIGGAWAPGR